MSCTYKLKQFTSGYIYVTSNGSRRLTKVVFTFQMVLKILNLIEKQRCGYSRIIELKGPSHQIRLAQECIIKKAFSWTWDAGLYPWIFHGTLKSWHWLPSNFHLPLSNSSGSSATCSWMARSAAISSCQDWLISPPVAFRKCNTSCLPIRPRASSPPLELSKKERVKNRL